MSSCIKYAVICLSLLSVLMACEQQGGEMVNQVKDFVPIDSTPADTKAMKDTVNQDVYYFSPAKSMIIGEIRKEEFNAPPDAGDVDLKQQEFILHSSTLINIVADVLHDSWAGSRGNISRIQLRAASTDINLSLYRNQKVRVTGNLFRTETSYDQTSVWMDVLKIEKL